MLREDNADLRLTEQGRDLGVVSNDHWKLFSTKRESIELETQRLKTTWVQANSEQADRLLEKLPSPLNREYSLYDLLKRPELGYRDVANLKGESVSDARVAEQIEISAKYSGYIDRQQEDIDRLKAYENTKIPDSFDYGIVDGLSNEVKQKLISSKPETLARASRISGVTPAAVSLLLVYLKKQGLLRRNKLSDSDESTARVS